MRLPPKGYAVQGDIQEEKLSVVQGDLDDEAKPREAVAGADAVISALGLTGNTPSDRSQRACSTSLRPWMPSTFPASSPPREPACRIPATSPVSPTRPSAELCASPPTPVGVQPAHGGSHPHQRSGLDVGACAAAQRQTGGGEIKVGYTGKGPTTQVSRADVARFLVDQLQSDAWLHKAPALSN